MSRFEIRSSGMPALFTLTHQMPTYKRTFPQRRRRDYCGKLLSCDFTVAATIRSSNLHPGSQNRVLNPFRPFTSGVPELSTESDSRKSTQGFEEAPNGLLTAISNLHPGPGCKSSKMPIQYSLWGGRRRVRNSSLIPPPILELIFRTEVLRRHWSLGRRNAIVSFSILPELVSQLPRSGLFARSGQVDLSE
jgi:hypothetical protein